MKRLIIFFFWFLCYGQAATQHAFEYYQKINEGKALAIEHDFESAIDSYQMAFKAIEAPFARDCINAIELAIMAEDSLMLPYFIEMALARGVRFEDIDGNMDLDRHLSIRLYEQVRNNSDSLMQKYLTNINWAIREEINQMFSDDQKIREEYYDTKLFKRKRVGAKWAKLNAAHVKRLIQITTIHGFPGEHLIGLDTKEMHPKIETSNYSAGMPIVLLIHHYSEPNASYDDILLKEVIKGNLYNEHFATISDFEAKFGKGKNQRLKYYGIRHKPKRIDVDTLNSRRNKIGILPIDQVEQLNQVYGLTKFWNRLY